MESSDPLLCAFTGRWFDLDYGCDCGQSEFAEHRWDCGVSPIFADMDRELLSDITNEFLRANLAMTQTVLPCAECGRLRAAKDLLPIYQAPTMRSDDYDGRYKYPGNIVKAVCPHHSRDGKLGYRHASWAGF